MTTINLLVQTYRNSCRIILLLLLFLPSSLLAETKATAAIASAHPLATEAGMEILSQGGNAFDAAVAVSAALAVVEPSGSGLGGGGFWLLHRASDGFEVMIDGRETAPSASHRDMYIDDNGKVNKTLSLNGPLAAAIPGVPAALDHLASNYGHLSLRQSLTPAIRYAKEGFPVDSHFHKLATFRLVALQASAESNKIFLTEGQVPQIGTIIKQIDLANTLEKIAQYGRAGFYQGSIGKQLVAGVQQAGGIWTSDDLLHYQVKEREPVRGHYQGYKVTSAALPSSGGIVIMMILNQLKQLPLSNANLVQKRHLIVEAMRRAYYDRSIYMGDADFVSVPTSKLLSPAHAKQLAENIDLEKATPSEQLPNFSDNPKGEDTTHFSIIDADGNRVSATLSINYPFGSCFIPPGTGVLLNDEMDDFSVQQNVSNAYGLTGNSANAIAANKRPLSSMSPSFIENDDRLMIIGTPGGSRIITMVLLGMLDFIDGKDAQEIVSASRFHHQYLPDQIQVESTGISDTELSPLKSRGHQLNRLSRQYGNMQVIIKNKQSGQLQASSDPRGIGLAIVK